MEFPRSETYTPSDTIRDTDSFRSLASDLNEPDLIKFFRAPQRNGKHKFSHNNIADLFGYSPRGIDHQIQRNLIAQEHYIVQTDHGKNTYWISGDGFLIIAMRSLKPKAIKYRLELFNLVNSLN